MKRSNINKQDALGVTQLFEAVSSLSYVRVELLLKRGAVPDLADNNGTTPLMEAASRGDLRIVNLLLQNGANPNLKDNFGDSAAEYAKKQGFDELAVVLRAQEPPRESV